MRIIYIDLDGVVADFDKGKKDHPLGERNSLHRTTRQITWSL